MIDDEPLVIGITGLNATDNPGPGIPVIRALRDGFGNNIRIIGLCYEPLEPGIYLKNVVDKTYQIPYPAAGANALLERLQHICQQENLQVLIPNFDAELYNFIILERPLKQLNIHTFLPSQQQLAMRDKVNLSVLGEQLQFNVPESYTITKIISLKEAAEKTGFPLVIKGKYYDAQVAETPQQAQEAFHKLSVKWGLPLIVQQFISGTEINVAVLGDGKGKVISQVSMRKMYITEKGKAWAGTTIADQDLADLAQQFTQKTQWKGAFELELIRNNQGKLYVIEINPRFPAWIYLAAAAGQNQPKTLVQMALGEEVAPFETYQTGKVFIRYAWDLITDIAEFQQIAAFGESG
ncbi:MAG: ATP-grasp domain-containing protein [Sphingobacteriaceae bacterium]|nr:MAG: ATP-grasp domain-containing protein [Sphingobacteriaceae bacterium]